MDIECAPSLRCLGGPGERVGDAGGCGELMSVTALVPMAFVKNVTRSIDFYKKLGFVVGDTHTPEGQTEPVWAWLKCGGAQLMLALATEPIDPREQAILFYVYCEDVSAFRSQLLASDVAAGPISSPFYAPRGEFRVTDPDGYTLMVTHT
jgi:catechol 2,3-dioxygenase-like lactoylglutathione lyase family enzyme